MKLSASQQIAAMQGMIDQLYVVSTRIDARIDGLVEIVEEILGSDEGPRLRETLIKHEYARMDAFFLMVEMVQPATAQRMRHIFNQMMAKEGKA